ncbi:MAG: TraM recognition domain-containing protein [Phaeodactylibacter sp.]|nr:TraM recognition domain-containing protein [Phaeodactylibacter sp.]
MQSKERPIVKGLDHPLAKFSLNKQDWWTVRDAVRGVQIFGGIGSGKSSGSGKTFAKAYLKNGYGGLVMCAKPDERENWEQLAKETGREDDLIIFREDSPYQFNPLDYELNRGGKGAGEIFNLTYLFMEIYKMGNRFTGSGGGGESERYWDNALKRNMNRMIQLLKLAEEEVSIKNMIKLLSYAPLEHEVDKLAEMSEEEIIKWGEENYCIGCIIEAGNKCEGTDKEEEYDLIKDYFLREFARLPDKTRPTIVESFLGLAEPFTSGILKKHFSGSTNLYPETSFEGKIIVLDFPVKEYLASGVYAQGIYKLLWQQAAERRNPKEELLPVFLWVDEAQLFLSDYDQIFQTTARSSRACTVFISQNISNYYAAIGGRDPRPKVDSLLGNLGTKVFHANNDAVTNEWAAKTIGNAFKNVRSINVGKEENTSAGISQQLLYLVEPREFTMLKSGGLENGLKVEGIVTVAGKTWSNNLNFYRAFFDQSI